jgi:DNA topoisomerase-3
LIRRNFVGREAKHLVPTELGMGLIQTLPVPSLASPELTGTWEARLARVARGQETRAAFMADISRYVAEVVTTIRGGRKPEAPPVSPNGAAPSRAGASAGAAVRSIAAPPKATSRATAAPLICPRCREGTLVAGNRGWGCTRWRLGCAFVIWFEVAGRRISDSELGDLISKGKTRRRKWPVAGGATTSARLVLDLAAPRDAGAARLET